MSPPSPVPPPPSRIPNPTRASTRVPALDGLRGLALLGMLAWHAQVGWIKGGFARMTIFFALSGFLATTSYLATRSSGQARPFLTFWRRRARRLLPITLVGVAAASLVTVVFGSAKAVSDLRGDVLSVLGYVSNWRFYANDQAYGALFERPSAFQHFWSLSLEEQLFWLLPFVVGGAVVVARRRAWIVVIAAAVVLAAIPAFVAHTPDAAYYGTHVRAGEFLAGVALALVLHRWGGIPTRARPAVRVAGAVSLAGLLGVMVAVDRDLPWLYQGGLGLFAVPAVLVIAAALDARGPVTRLLSVAPLVLVGRWAFSIYVLHWPLFLVLSPSRTGLSGAALASVQLVCAVALGAVVHHLIERPLLAPAPRGDQVSVRRVSWWHRDAVALPVMASVALAIVAAVALVPADRQVVYDFEAAARVANQSPAPEVEPAMLADGPDRTALGLFGGSTAVMLGGRVWDWAGTSAATRAVPGSSQLGCGLLTDGERVFARASDGGLEHARPDDHCLDWQRRWPSAVTENGVELALVLTGVWDTADWLLDGDDRWRAVGDPVVDEMLRERLRLVVDLLNGQGAFVVLATTPEVGPGSDGEARAVRGIGADHGDRVRAYNDLVRSVVAEYPMADVVEYGSFIDGLGPDGSAEWLPDGIHPTWEHSLDIWNTFLGPAIDDVAARWRTLRSMTVDETLAA